MDFNLSDEQQMLQDSARRYLDKQYPFSVRESIVRQCGLSLDKWREFAEMGWLAATVPQALDGVGFGPVEGAILSEEMGRALVLEPYIQACLFPAAVLEHCANVTQQTEWLPVIGAGASLITVAHSEPQSRGNVAWVETRAVRQSDGSYRLSGRKSIVVCAAQAEHLLVVARSAGQAGDMEGISLFCLPRQTPGVSLEPVTLLDGTPAADVLLDEVQVPAHALLGEEGGAYAGLQQAVDQAIAYQCAQVVGAMEDVLALCSEYLKTRKQFGVPIGTFQALQHRMADMAIETMQARASLHRALAALAADMTAAQRSIAVSGCKAQVIKSARFVTAQGIQLHGGFGITEEYRVGHHYRNLVLINASLGAQDYHLARYTGALQQACEVAARSQ